MRNGKENKPVLVTCTSGPEHTELSWYTYPTISAYADNVGADFLAMVGGGGRTCPHFRKFDALDLVSGRKRRGFIDTDMLVDPRSPSIFDVVPAGKLGVRVEHPVVHERSLLWLMGEIADFEIPTGRGPVRVGSLKWDGVYFNSGLMVMDEKSDLGLSIPEGFESRFDNYIAEQNLFNIIRLARGIEIFDVGDRFNGFKKRPGRDAGVNFYHYLWTEGRVSMVREDSKVLWSQVESGGKNV